MAIRPIFIFSITRSGSTLLQRIVAAHDGVATVSEPWLLLPLLYTLRERGVRAEYGHDMATGAIADFCKELPRGTEDYRTELRELVLRLYRRAAGEEARYFLDKSPPYFFVVEEIVELFPEAKLVFLWRNPLSIIASIIETWEQGRWHANAHGEDLLIGLPRLVAAYRRHGARAHAVRYEDLLAPDATHTVRALMEYLEIPFEPAALERFAQVALSGRTGDPVGVKAYSALSSEPMQKWRQTLANPLRREWCRRYLRFLGEERLATMGYDSRRLLAELNDQPLATASLLADVGRLLEDVAREPWRVRMRRRGVGGPNVLRTLISA